MNSADPHAASSADAAAPARPPADSHPTSDTVRATPPGPPRQKPVIREYLDALLIAVVLALFLRTFLLQPFKIPTGSMETNLLIGDHLLVNKFVYGSTIWPEEEEILPLRDIRRGDVVVFKFPQDASRDFIKRCVALPGDQVEIVDKQLWVNGSQVDDASYVRHIDARVYPRSLYLHDNFRKRDNFGPYTVPRDTFFCLGDNRDNSHDSRFWGPVPATYVKGRAWLIYWSVEPRRVSPTASGVEAGPTDLAPADSTDPELAVFRTRWSRSLRLVR